MGILDLQRRIAEVGRIRIGQQVSTGKGRGTRPSKLDTFRLTSPDKTRIEHAAHLYGGDVKPWEAPAGAQWEVITNTAVLPVIVPPSDMAFSQWYESWSGGGCQRRCDGLNESITQGPCLCDPEKRECSIHTRLSVMLRDLPGLGVWRIDTSGYYAGVELQGAVEVVQMAAGRGQMLPASLRLEQRQIKRTGEGVKRFAVPVLDIAVSPAQLLGGGDPLDRGTLAIEPAAGVPSFDNGPRGNVTPVPDTVPERPTPPVSEQAKQTRERKPRKNAAKPIPPTGLEPRTAAQAAADNRSENTPPPPEDDPGPPDDAPPPPADDRAKLNRQMHALFRKAGIEKDRREDRLTVTSYLAKRPDIQSSNDLNDTEFETAVNTLAGWDREGKIVDKVADILDQAAIDKWQGSEQQSEGVNS